MPRPDHELIHEWYTPSPRLRRHRSSTSGLRDACPRLFGIVRPDSVEPCPESPANYLWFSDIALIGTVAALWLESGLLASAMLVGTLLPELLWNVGLVSRLLFGVRITGVVDYMFESERPLYLKLISLFHIPMPLTWAVTDPRRNINRVHGPGSEGVRQTTTLHPLAWLALLMIGVPVGMYLPTHWLLLYLFT